MYKYLLVVLAIAPYQAVASMAVATCDGSATVGTLTASCNDGSSSASVIAASTVKDDNPATLDLNVSGLSASASFAGSYELIVTPELPSDGGLDGFFAPDFEVTNWADVSISIDGLVITQGMGTTIMSYTNGEAEFSVSVSIWGTDSIEMHLRHFWTPPGSSITPPYQLTSTEKSPEPSRLISMCSGLLLLVASGWMRRRSHNANRAVD